MMQRKIGPWVLGAIVVLVSFIGLVRWGNRKNTTSHENILQMGTAIATAYRINSTMSILQGNANGYYLTGDPNFKVNVQKATQKIDSLMHSIRELTKSKMVQKRRIDTLQFLLNKRMALSDSIVYIYDHKINSEYYALFKRQFLLDSIYNSYYSAVFAEESGVLKSKIKDNFTIIRKALLLLFAFGLLSLVILILIFIRINKIIRKRKKLAEYKIREGEQRYKQLIEDARVVLYTTDLEGRFTFVNGRAETLTGYPARELVGKSYEMVISPDFFPIVRDYYIQQIKLKFPESELEFPIQRKDGSIRWVEQFAALLYDENSRVRGFQCIVKDIDEQKKLQLNMQEIEDNKKRYQFLLQAILDYSPSLIFVKDKGSKYLIINKMFEDIFALAGKDVIGKDDYAFNSPEAAARFHEGDQWILEHKRPNKSIQVLETSNGPRSYVVTKFPLMTITGEVDGVCGIAMDISDQIEKEKELVQARKKAEDAEKAQEYFLAHVSHEIRTPLNGIIGMANLLKDSALTAEQQDFVKIISNSSEILLYLINDLLDTAKIKAGKLTLENIRFNLEELIDRTLSGLYFRAKEKKIKLKSILSPDVPNILIGDPHRLSQILLNLLGNAIKFTHEGQVVIRIFVKSREAKKVWIQFVVEDTGIGIPADKMNSLFKEFSQVSTDTSRKYGGTGLGLSITEKLVRLQKGNIEVESEEGKGSRFIICIPYTYEMGILEDGSNGRKGGMSDISLQGVNILLVDDNVINQKVAGKILQNAEANTIFASTGKEAVSYLAHNQPPDIILMDLMMPEMDGYEATENIRNELKLSLPIIAMTATVLEEEKKRCLEIGMNEYISKPFSARELISLIDKLIRPQM